jgi:hypothetical protein
MNKIILFIVLVLSLIKYSVQDCCFNIQINGDGKISYYVDVSVTPSKAKQYYFSYLDDYILTEVDPNCAPNEDGSQLVCQNNSEKSYFHTRLVMQSPNPEKYINDVELIVSADNEKCIKSYACSDNGKVKNTNADQYCFFFGCFPKLACYLGVAAFIICILGISIAIIHRNSGSGEKAALDRPNTKSDHLDPRPDPISNYTTTTNKETLIQIDEMPVDYKEAGTTNWKQKYNSQPAKDLGLGLGSGGFGSKSSLLPTSSVTVLNDPNAGLNRGRSVKRAQSTKKGNHLNAPPLPNNSSPLYSHASLGRNKSTRSTKSVKSTKSTKSIRKTRPSESNNLSTKKSIRNQKRYQIPSYSDSDSDSDNEVLGLRAKASTKRLNNSSSLPRKSGYHSSTKASLPRHHRYEYD